MPLPASSRRWSQVAPRVALAMKSLPPLIGGSSLTNNGSMVASANGGQGHLFQGPPSDFAFLLLKPSMRRHAHQQQDYSGGGDLGWKHLRGGCRGEW